MRAERKLTEAEALLFVEPNFGTAAVLRPDGSPHQTVVWVDWDGERPLFNTAEGRAKLEYLRRDPRVSLLVVDRHDPWRWVSVSGTADLVEEGAEESIHRLGRRYRGWDRYPLKPGEKRVIVRIRVERVTAYRV
ncbi:MAG: PPOX class F420-dependent oxidoreductase [Thermoleophilia bacterium]|nr:PPOX class F420-dependent oxidoreductase [Thermoleophilia bacterium]